MDASTPTVERHPKCDTERYCDMLSYVLDHSPQNIPWALNPVLMTVDDKPRRAVVMRPGKKTPYDGSQFLILFCPFCGVSLTQEEKPVEKSRVWRPPWRRS